MIKRRNIALCIILSLVTCGIYGIYWFVCLTEDTKTAANVEGTDKQGEKIDIAKQNRNMPSSNSGVLYLILCLIFPVVAWALMQNELNNFAEE